MLVVALILAFAATGFLGWRQWLLERKLRDFADAAVQRRAILLERDYVLLKRFGLTRLLREYNTVLDERSQKDRSAQSYLGQIQATLESIREAVVILNEAQVVVVANDAMQALAGTDAALVGQRLEAVLPQGDLVEYVQEVYKSGKGREIEIEIELRKEPRHLVVSGSELPLHEEGGGIWVLLVLQDVTKQRRLERMRTEFVANVSHELRTPVTVIKGFTDTLIEDRDDLSGEEQQRFLLKIKRNVQRLYEMLEELLLLSRLEARKEDFLKPEACDLPRLIHEVADNFRARLGEEVALELSLYTQSQRIWIDPLRVTQVLNNLLENVLRHARGCNRILVVAELQQGEVLCYVEDDGPGIVEDDRAHIFERFYRGDKGRSRESGGTGLGLSIVKHIVQLHGGQVFVESTPRVATRIGFTLPLEHAGEQGTLPLEAVSKPAEAAPSAAQP